MTEKPHHHTAWIIAGITPVLLIIGGVYSLGCKIARGRHRYSSIGVIHQAFEHEERRKK